VVPIKHKFCFFIRAQSAEIGPPLGTVLGNSGINATSFVKEFNEFTQELPNYFTVRVHILLFEDRTFDFTIEPPSTGFLLNFLKKKKEVEMIKKRKEEIVPANYIIGLKDIVQVALFKFPEMSLVDSVPMVIGTLHSCGLIIEMI
jgi:ribosomal protein L11